MLVPRIGGLVNLVLSIAAITAGSLLLPVLWTLFAKKQNAQSILVVSLVGLAVGLVFKFLTPAVFNFSLSRAAEMSVGVGLPLVMLAFFEWVVFKNKDQDEQFTRYQHWNASRDQIVAAELSTDIPATSCLLYTSRCV